MSTQEKQTKIREVWLKTYQQLGSVTKAARRCGIARSTLHRWLSRFEKQGKEGLRDLPKKPKRLARLKVTAEQEQLILQIRNQYGYGQKRISMHLLRYHQLSLSTTTIWRILRKYQVAPVKKQRHHQKRKRYNRPIPGDRVQMDVTKVAAKCYQFTAIDDCTRLRVLRIYPDKTVGSSLAFLKEVTDAFPFPIQRIQTDWGSEFFNYPFQEALAEKFIKFRPIKPRSPHLNGKVERSQQTDKVEFYPFLRKSQTTNLIDALQEWEAFYNQKRPHSSLHGKTPWEKLLEVKETIPTTQQVQEQYQKKKHPILARNYFFLQWQKKNGMT